MVPPPPTPRIIGYIMVVQMEKPAVKDWPETTKVTGLLS